MILYVWVIKLGFGRLERNELEPNKTRARNNVGNS